MNKNDLAFIVEDHAAFYFGVGTTIDELIDYTEDRLPDLHEITATLRSNFNSELILSEVIPKLMQYPKVFEYLIAQGARFRIISGKEHREILLDKNFIIDYGLDGNGFEEITLLVIPKASI